MRFEETERPGGRSRNAYELPITAQIKPALIPRQVP